MHGSEAMRMRSLVRAFVVYKCNKILLYSVRSDLIRLLFMLDSKPMLDHSQPAYSVHQHRPASEPMVARFKIFFWAHT